MREAVLYFKIDGSPATPFCGYGVIWSGHVPFVAPAVIAALSAMDAGCLTNTDSRDEQNTFHITHI